MDSSLMAILFLIIIFIFLMYSCQWFIRTLRKYQEARRDFEAQERNPQRDYQFSVFTIEQGRRTLIQYPPPGTIPPRAPAYVAEMKFEELPPSYEHVVQQETRFNDPLPPAPVTLQTANVSDNPQRRHSSVL